MNEIKVNTIYCGNALEVLKNFPDNFFDGIITDPPYGLSDHKYEIIVKTLKEWLQGNDEFIPGGRGFRSHEWDCFVPPPAIWKQCFRVLKPGGHMLVFAGTRSVDLMGLSIRLGGFEIRDTIEWCYGEGFPKSMDIGKMVDKIQGNEREIIGENPNVRPNCGPDNTLYKYGATGKAAPLTRGKSRWEGWGTALKPAHEPILLTRKPLERGLTIAENVLKWGTGGLNVGECRIGEEKRFNPWLRHKPGGNSLNMSVQGMPRKEGGVNVIGRFPANIILDNSEEVAGCFPETKSGKYKGPSARKRKGWMLGEVYGKSNAPDNYGDNGSASRFFFKAELEEDDIRSLFYCSKATKKERGEYNKHLTVKPIRLIEYLVKLIIPKEGIVLDPFLGSGTTAVACKRLGRRWAGVEINKKYCEIAERRINATPDPLVV